MVEWRALQAIIGEDHDEESCRALLEASGGSMERAVALFFESVNSTRRRQRDDNDDGDDVRAPDSVKRQTLLAPPGGMRSIQSYLPILNNPRSRGANVARHNLLSNQQLEDDALSMALAVSMQDQKKKKEEVEVVEIDDDDVEDDGIQGMESRQPTTTTSSSSNNAGGSASRHNQTVYSVDDDEEEVEVKEKGQQKKEDQASSSLPFERVELPPEPEAGVDRVTRVMVRSVEGKRLARRFLLDDPVSYVYRYAHEQVAPPDDAGNGKKFDISTSFPSKSLWEAMIAGQTIEESKIDNATLMMTWIEKEE